MARDTIKFGVDIPTELNDSLNRRIPWGLKSQLFRIMLNRLDYELSVGGNDALAEWLNWKRPIVPNRNTSGENNHG